MHWRYKAVSLAVCTVTLSGCASFNNWMANSKTFHNREHDYLRQTVAERGPLKTPEGLQQPDYKPVFDLPQKSHALQPAKGIAMTPPTMTNSNTESLKHTLDQLQTQLAQMRVQQDQSQTAKPSTVDSAAPASAAKTNASDIKHSSVKQGGLFDPPKPQRPLSQVANSASKTEVVTLDFNADTDTLTSSANTQPVQVNVDYDADSGMLGAPALADVPQRSSVRTVKMDLTDSSVATKPAQKVSASVVKPATTVQRHRLLTSPFSVSINQTQAGIPYVGVTGDFAEVWRATQIAVQHLGYRITQMNQQEGYLFIQPQRQPDQPSILLYVQQQGKQIHLIVYDDQGNPSTTAAAENMLSSLATELMQTS